MNAKYLLTWGIVIGFGLGAVAISGLKAQPSLIPMIRPVMSLLK